MKAFDLDSPLRLRDWLAGCNTLYELRDPGDGSPVWLAVSAGDPAPFAPPARSPAVSPKSFFFAERETLYRFEPARADQPAAFVASLPPVASQVLFGVHACDLAAIAYMDWVFRDDLHYQARRASTLLVGFDCVQPCEGGFCSLVDAGPNVRAGCADLILLATEAQWLLLSDSPAGDSVCAALGLLPASCDWQARRRQQQLVAAETQGDGRWLQRGIQALGEPARLLPVLRELATRCFGCSGCSMVCPTCSCFAPRERASADGNIQHERVWDSCLFEGFQREGSGHNPMAAPELRLLRFWQHKFGAGFYQQAGRHGCVGCGRCDRVCPGGIGVRTVLGRGGETCRE